MLDTPTPTPTLTPTLTRNRKRPNEVLQKWGCLPQGFDLDSQLTVQQFAIWQQISVATAYAALASIKGVFTQSREWIRINPRSFVEANQKK